MAIETKGEECRLSQKVLKARQVGTPITYIETGDPLACIVKLEINGGLREVPANKKDPNKQCPVVTWDLDSGALARNAEGKSIVAELSRGPSLPGPPPGQTQTQSLPAFLKKIETINLPSVVFVTLPTTEAINQATTIQKIYNLRGTLKAKGVMLIFTGPPVQLPPILRDSVLCLRHEKPNLDELLSIVEKNYKSAKGVNENFPEIPSETLSKAAMGLRGLGSFAAENSFAMSLDRQGINFTTLQEQRYAMIERPGLKVWKGKETFKDVIGLDGVCQSAYEIATSKKLNVGAVAYVDEIEKSFKGSGGGDISGMSDRHLGQFLKWLEDHKIPMMLFVGHPGCGKTEVSKALGNEAKLLTLQLEIEMTKGSLMGESEHNLQDAFDTVMSVSGGSPLVIASCNEADSLPSALMRRVRFGSFFFDLPSSEVKKRIWSAKITKYELPEQEIPDDDQWAGHEIEVCAYKSWVNGRSLVENARTIVPVGRLRQHEIASLRTKAEGNYLSAVTGLPYYQGETCEIKTETISRKINVH